MTLETCSLTKVFETEEEAKLYVLGTGLICTKHLIVDENDLAQKLVWVNYFENQLFCIAIFEIPPKIAS